MQQHSDIAVCITNSYKNMVACSIINKILPITVIVFTNNNCDAILHFTKSILMQPVCIPLKVSVSSILSIEFNFQQFHGWK